MILDDPWFLWLALLLIVPFCISRFRRTIDFPNAQSLRGLKRKWHYGIPTVLLLLSGLLIVIAVCDPQLGVVKTETELLATSTVVSLDLSGSMRAKMEDLKSATRIFLESMEQNSANNLVGLTVFSSNAYIVCPPTRDYVALYKFLQTVSPSTLGQSTAIGRGLLMSANALTGDKTSYESLREVAERQEGAPLHTKGKVIVLFSDGEHNHGIKVPPVLALIKKMGIRVYFIRAGNQRVPAKVSELIRATGGDYYHITNITKLKAIYKEIASLEKSRTKQASYKEHKRLYQKFVLAGLLLFVLGVSMRECLFLRI